VRALVRSSLACLRQLWLAILLCAVIIPIADRFLGQTSMTLLLYCVQTGLAYLIFRHILTHDGGPTSPLALPAFAASMAALLVAVFALGWWLPEPALLFRPTLTVPWTFQAYKFTNFAVFYLPYWVILSFFGVVLSGAANGDLRGIGQRLGQSQPTIMRMAGQMLLAPGLFLGICTIWVIPGLFALTDGWELLKAARRFGIVLGVLTYPVISFGAILTAVILCDAYRRIPPAPVDTAA